MASDTDRGRDPIRYRVRGRGRNGGKFAVGVRRAAAFPVRPEQSFPRDQRTRRAVEFRLLGRTTAYSLPSSGNCARALVI